MDIEDFTTYITDKNFTQLTNEDITIGYLKSLVTMPLLISLLILSLIDSLPDTVLQIFIVFGILVEVLFLIFPRLGEFRVNRLKMFKRRCC